MQAYLGKRAAEREAGSTDVLVVCSSPAAGEGLSEADGLISEGERASPICAFGMMSLLILHESLSPFVTNFIFENFRPIWMCLSTIFTGRLIVYMSTYCCQQET